MGRKIKKPSILILGLALATLLLGSSSSIVFAEPAAPDSLEILSAQVYRNVASDGDALVVFQYNIHYITDPEERADQLFIFRLFSPANEELGIVLPYAFYSNGYEQGVSAFYFAISPLTWGEANKIQIVGNPSQFASPLELNYYLAPSDYCESIEQGENQKVLADYLINVARDLEANWSTSLIEETQVGSVLNSTGEAYFRGAILGLQTMCPLIFYIQLITPEYDQVTRGTQQATEYKERYKNTWVGTALKTTANQFHVEPTMITGGFILIAMLGVMILSFKFFHTTTPGLVTALLLFVMGGVMGWVPMAMIAIGSLGMAMFLFYTFFFRSAT